MMFVSSRVVVSLAHKLLAIKFVVIFPFDKFLVSSFQFVVSRLLVVLALCDSRDHVCTLDDLVVNIIHDVDDSRCLHEFQQHYSCTMVLPNTSWLDFRNLIINQLLIFLFRSSLVLLIGSALFVFSDVRDFLILISTTVHMLVSLPHVFFIP